MSDVARIQLPEGIDIEQAAAHVVRSLAGESRPEIVSTYLGDHQIVAGRGDCIADIVARYNREMAAAA